MAGRITSCPISSSKARSTASFKKVPPCTTIFLPSALAFAVRMTLYSAFFTTLMDSPAEMFSSEAPSFCACFTEEFIKTVQREPRSTGRSARMPFTANSSTLISHAEAKACKNEPQPEEQASFKKILSMAPPRILKHLMSCPPISMMKSTSGSKARAAVKCAMVSTMPASMRKAFFTSSSP